MDIGSILEMQAEEIRLLRQDVNRLKQQETPVVGLSNAFLAAQDGRIGAAEDILANMSPTALAWAVYCSVPTFFSGIRGAWFMNEYLNTVGAATIQDSSSQERHFTRNGGVSGARINNLVPVISLNGIDGYGNRASESSLEITTNFSIMGWVYKSLAGQQFPVLAKTQSLTGNTNFAYWMTHGSADNLNLSVCSGSTTKAITLAAPVGSWYFGAVVFQKEIAGTVYVGTQDGWDSASDSEDIPASINSATSTDLTLGALHGGVSPSTGFLGLTALMTSIPPEEKFRNYFEFTKGLFYGFN